MTRPISLPRAALAALLALAAAPSTAIDPHPSREPDVIYVPTPPRVVELMMTMAEVRAGDVVYDLGCGDGRLVIAAAKRGARKAVCVEIDPERIRDARANARAAKVEDRITFVQGDLFEVDFSDATVITLYLLDELNMRLRPRILALPPGTRVVSHSFEMGDWKPDRVEHLDGKTVYAWKVPQRGGGPAAAGPR